MCVVDDAGAVLSVLKVETEPDYIAALLESIGGDYARGWPLSQWLVSALMEAGLYATSSPNLHSIT